MKNLSIIFIITFFTFILSNCKNDEALVKSGSSDDNVKMIMDLASKYNLQEGKDFFIEPSRLPKNIDIAKYDAMFARIRDTKTTVLPNNTNLDSLMTELSNQGYNIDQYTHEEAESEADIIETSRLFHAALKNCVTEADTLAVYKKYNRKIIKVVDGVPYTTTFESSKARTIDNQ